jgi:diguanylate cyclase (GGDEF)-like protein
MTITPSPNGLRDALSALRDQLIVEAAQRFDMASVVARIAEALTAAGLAPTRVSLAVLSVHPSLAGVGFTWSRGEPEVSRVERPYGFLDDPEHRASPLHAVMTRRAPLRLRLCQHDGADAFPVASAFRERGGTDYAAFPLPSARDEVHVLSLLTDRPGGWEDAELAHLDIVLPTLALLLEVSEAQRLNARERAGLVALIQSDLLTGMLNRHGVMLEADNHFGPGRPSIATAVDIDSLKGVNDRLGHRYGDAVIRDAAARIRAALPEGAVAGRIEGDEFLVFADASHVALPEALRSALAAPYEVDGVRLSVTASVGTAIGTFNAEELARRADLAMLLAKRQGRNRVVPFTPEADARRMRAERIAQLLPHALATGELRIVIQPIVALDSRRLVAGECLARWTSPELGVVGPEEFIPIAEQSGDIAILDRYVLRAALRVLSELARRGLAPISLSVNVSARDAAMTELDAEIVGELQQYGVSPSLLTVELTESVFVGSGATAPRQLSRLREHGISIAMDDFGTGYSSLSYLQRMEIDCIKVDRSMVMALPSPRASAIVRSVVDLGRALHARVVAEGVETAVQSDALRSLGCELGQGYLFAPPVEVPAWMDRVAQA